MSKNIIKTILAAAVIAACTVNFAGCKKEEYTIDTPYDFSQITSGQIDVSGQKGDENKPTAAADEGKENNAENQSSDANSQGGAQSNENSTAVPGDSATSSSGASSNNNSSTDQKPSSGGSTDSDNTGSSGTQGNTSGSTGGSSGTQGNTSGSTGGSSSENTTTEPEGPSFIEIAEDYQIPKDIEYKMTTKALLDTYMSYPFIDILCFEASPEESYNQWINSDSSCGKELMGRKDVVSVALTYYKGLIAMEPTTHIESDDEINLELKLDWIELLLHQDAVKNKASDKEKADILKQAQLRDSNVEKNGYAITDLLPDLAAAYK
jgi:hypothetical protein